MATLAEDIEICSKCEISPVQIRCNSCAANLCKACVGEHVLHDSKKDHQVVIFKKEKPIFPRCKTHKENCQMKCRQCDHPVCIQCIHSGSHKQHDLYDVLKLFNSNKVSIKQKTNELETSVYPKYEKIVSELEVQLRDLLQAYDMMMSQISDQGKVWHQEVDIVINKCKQQVEKMRADDLATLRKLQEEMKNILPTLRQAIMDNKKLLQSPDITEVLDNESTSLGMWTPPPSVEFTPPIFIPLPIQQKQLHQMFGTLTAASLPLSGAKIVEDKLDTPVNQLQLPDSLKPLSSLPTAYQSGLYSIACLSSDQIWACGRGDRKIKCFSHMGSLQETVTTTTGHTPHGITITRQGDLIYTDHDDRSINRVRHGMTEKIISLEHDWRPLRVCSTSSDNLLITMEKLSTPGRVVRYSGSTEKQVIQFDNQGKPFFSSSLHLTLFIAEKSDKDMICVSDLGTDTVVALNHAGKLRFRYTGNLSSKKYKSFSPCGVVIDSMGHILVSDRTNACIHIIDQQGHLIQYIENCHLSQPWDLSLDRNNTLYVAEETTDEVKIINYLI